jgi:NTP pyrophosphatase (non-canonical NTP hydrolase)
MRQIQREHWEWVLHNFGRVDAHHFLILHMEEFGELCQAHEKPILGIRMDTDWDAKARGEIGDVILCLMGYASRRGWDIEECLAEKWAKVRERDWRADPLAGRVDGAGDQG